MDCSWETLDFLNFFSMSLDLANLMLSVEIDLVLYNRDLPKKYFSNIYFVHRFNIRVCTTNAIFRQTMTNCSIFTYIYDHFTPDSFPQHISSNFFYNKW